ncbi:Rpn family recombination-promoting nuclease/putative transposase, partial [Salmonella enterica subsp. enterica serovar Anatum]|nr:Rpn family recombination-promoting nuclease/putative transposase [Salmonella enterica subsp. enterica serovar Anatum]
LQHRRIAMLELLQKHIRQRDLSELLDPLITLLTQDHLTDAQLKKLGGRELRALGKLMPGEKEVAENPRARSSVLRIAERTN